MRRALKPAYTLSDDKTLSLGNDVITGLENNGHIPSPQPSVDDLKAAWNAFKISDGKARKGSIEDKKQKNADKKVLLTLLRDESDYVNNVAKGDEVILASTKFPLSKDRQPRVLGIPEAKVEQGDNGDMILSTPALDGAVCYIHQYKPVDAGDAWSEISSSTAKQKIPGLALGTFYNFRIRAIGTKGQITTSNVVTRMAA